MQVQSNAFHKITGPSGYGDFLFFKVVKNLSDSRYLIRLGGKRFELFTTIPLVRNHKYLGKIIQDKAGNIRLIELKKEVQPKDFVQVDKELPKRWNRFTLRLLDDLELKTPQERESFLQVLWDNSKNNQREPLQSGEDLQRSVDLWLGKSRWFLLPLIIQTPLGDKDGLLHFRQETSQSPLVFSLELKGIKGLWIFNLEYFRGSWSVEGSTQDAEFLDSPPPSWKDLCDVWEKRGIRVKRDLKSLKEPPVIADLIREERSSFLDIRI